MGAIITVIAFGLGLAGIAGVGGAVAMQAVRVASRYRRLKCGARIRGLKGRDDECNRALLAFLREWGMYFGVAESAILREEISSLKIHFLVSERVLAETGRMVSRNAIEVLDRGPLGRSALFHELVHWANWQLYGDPDPNHAAPNGPPHKTI